MRGAFPLVVLAGLVPILVLSLIAVGLSLNLVLWQPSSLWSVQFPARNYDNGFTAIYADNTAVYAAGVSTDFRGGPAGNFFFLNKYYPDGKLIWTQRSTNQSLGIEITGIQTDSSGEYIGGVGGAVNGGILEKFDNNGTTVWTRQYNNLSITSTALGSSGLYAGGQLGYVNSSGIIRGYDLSGNLLWTDISDNQTSRLYLVVHSTSLYAQSNTVSNSFLRKYSSNGTLSWTASGCSCRASSISDDPTGIYVSGGGPPLGILEKHDFNGNILWTTMISSPDHSGVGDPIVSANAYGVYVTFASGAGHTFVSRYDTGGNLVWSFQTQQYGSSSIFAGPDGVYVGYRGLQALLAKFSESSSLVFFGINPPYSFVAVGLLGGGAATGILLLRRYRKKRVHPSSANVMRYGPKLGPAV